MTTPLALGLACLALATSAGAAPAAKPKKPAPTKPAAPAPTPPPATEAKPPPAAAPEAPAARIFPFAVEEHTLPNGLKVLFVTFDSPGLTAYFSLVRTGSRNEVEPGLSGFAHFFEHMMFRGTKKHPEQEYDALLSAAGIAKNAFTTDDFTAYHDFGPSKALPLVIELESDRFQNLDYSEDAFKTEAKAVLGEYNKNFADPGEKMSEVLLDTAFTTHPYKHTVMGFKPDIEAMPTRYAYSRQFFERWYRPDNVTLILVGDFDHAATLALIEQAYGGWQGKASTLLIPVEPKQTAARAVNLRWHNPTQPRLVEVWHTPEARADTKFAALQNVLAPYLFGPTSPTYRDLVLERQLVLGLGPSYYDHRDPNLFGVGAELKSDQDFAEVRKTMAQAIADLRAGKVDAARLEAVKSNQKYGLLNSFDNPESVAEQLVFAIGPTGAPDALDALFRHMERLTAQDLVDFAKAYLVPENSTFVSLVGPGQSPPAGVPDYQPPAAAAAEKKGGAQ
ncbi:MAG: pitrilysin family protein [Myxococcales bacterium]